MSSIIITGAGSGIGALAARSLALAGHDVHAGIRAIDGRNREAALAADEFARQHGVLLATVELDVADSQSVEAAVDTVLARSGEIDVVVHNAGHMTLGPSEAFSVEEMAAIYDTNVLGTQRVNRAVLPHLRARGNGLVLWVSSSSVKGGMPPYLGPYFAAKAAMDSLAVTYAAELARWGVETSIVVPGAFTTGTNHFANAGFPSNSDLVHDYDTRYPSLMDEVGAALSRLMPPGADVQSVADAIVSIVDAPRGQRPFRVHIDPIDDGSAAVSAVADEVRVQFLTRLGLSDLLHPLTESGEEKPGSRNER
jgi:NAD(P)-dependent dehydrogenase (short-subunit alcohol dehydrogenase family)